jgi:hypothetical protein
MSVDDTEFQTLYDRSAKALGDMGFPGYNIDLDTYDLFALLGNQSDPVRYPYSGIATNLASLSTRSNLSNTTINSQDKLDNMLLKPVTESTPFEKYIKYALAQMAIFYIQFFNMPVVNKNVPYYDIDDPNTSLPPYYKEFVPNTSSELIKGFNNIAVGSIVNEGKSSDEIRDYINNIFDSLSLPNIPDNGLDLYPQTTNEISLINFYKLCAMGLYYYAWMAKYVHKI